MGLLAVVGEVHLIKARLAGEILYLDGVVSLSRRASKMIRTVKYGFQKLTR